MGYKKRPEVKSTKEQSQKKEKKSVPVTGNFQSNSEQLRRGKDEKERVDHQQDGAKLV